MGAESEVSNILDLKDSVFGAGDTDNDLMIKQDSSYILCHHINRRSDCYPHLLSALSYSIVCKLDICHLIDAFL